MRNLQNRNRFLYILFIISTLLSACGGGNSPNKDNNLGNDSLQNIELGGNSGLLIKFKAYVTIANQKAILNENGLTEAANYSFMPGLVYAKPNNGTSLAASLSKIKTYDSIVYAEPDYTIEASSLAVNTSNAINKTGTLMRALPQNTTNQNKENSSITTVAILSTGIDFNHDAFVGNIWVNTNEIPLNNIDDDHNGWVDDIYGWNFAEGHNNPMDENGLGTHAAGLIIGKFGNNKNLAADSIKLVSLKVLDRSGRGKISALLKAFDYIVKNNIKISNNNWGTKNKSLALKDALQQLNKYDHLLIAAAGDNTLNLDEENFYPASYSLSRLISVVALDNNGNVDSRSNTGKDIQQLAAPGYEISSTGINNSYKTLSGSAVASALVTGLAVRVNDKFPKFSSIETSNWILNNVVDNQASSPSSNAITKIENIKLALAAINPIEEDITTPAIPDTSNPLSPPEISTTNLSVPVGNTLQIQITGGSAPYTWVIEDSNVVSVDESGLLHGLNPGSTKISVIDSNSLVSNTLSLTIAAMTIGPVNLSQMTIQQRLTLNAIGGTAPYSWSISDNSVAKLSVMPENSVENILIPLKTGTVSITLEDALGNVSIVENIEINIPQLTVTPSALNLDIGQNIQLDISGGTAPYTIISNDKNIVQADLGGFVSAKSDGIASIIVSDAESQVSVIAVIVNPNISITANRHILAINETMPITTIAELGVVSWASSDSSIISVDQNGQVTALAPGIATIKVMDSLGRSGSIMLEARKLNITSSATEITIKDPAIQLNASGGAAPYSWSVNNNLATINNDGILKPFVPGVVTVTAIDADGFKRSVDIIINPTPLSVNQSNLVFAVNDSMQLIASGGDNNYTWMSNDESIVSVNNNGFVNALALGSTSIVLSDNSGQSIEIAVSVKEIGLQVASTNLFITDPGLAISVTGGTEPYSWSSSDPAIATIDSNGFFAPLQPGNVTVSVSDANALQASIDMTISVKPISITPINVVMDVNQSLQFSAMGGDGQYTWSSNDDSVVSIDNKGLATSLGIGNANILLDDGLSNSISAKVEVRQVQLLSPATTLTVGEPDLQLSVSGGVAPYTWISSDPAIATVSSAGEVTPLKSGTVTITVSDTDGITGSSNITINDAVLSINNNNLLLAIADTFSLVAMGGDGNYSWLSNNPTIASIDSNGIVTAKSPGSTSIVLTDNNGQSVLVYVEVRSVIISNNLNSITVGDTPQTLVAMGGRAPYFWTTDNNNITVDQNGNITAQAAGTATITATDQDGFSGSTTITVFDTLSISQSTANLVKGDLLALTVSGGNGNYSWSSNQPDVASVDQSGNVTALNPGTAIISASDSNNHIITVSVDVTNIQITSSQTQILITQPSLQITAFDGAAPYSWQVSNSSIASIDSSGLLTPLGIGNIDVTATDANNNSATIKISITAEALVVNQTNLLLAPADTFQLVASGGDNNYAWASADNSVATVNSNGNVTAVSAGNTTITLTDGVGQTQIVNIEVREISISATQTSLLLNETLKLSAQDGAAPYTWTSSNTSVATIDPSGNLTAQYVGTVDIVATDKDGFSAAIQISVTAPAMTINQTSAILKPNDSLQLTVSGGDGNYSWSSDDNGIASVNSGGQITANNTGNTTITVTDGLGTSLNVDIEVREVLLSASSSSVAIGSSLQINASGGNSPYTWQSSDTSIATIDSNGRLVGQASGSVTVTAIDQDGFSGSIDISVYRLFGGRH